MRARASNRLTSAKSRTLLLSLRSTKPCKASVSSPIRARADFERIWLRLLPPYAEPIKTCFRSGRRELLAFPVVTSVARTGHGASRLRRVRREVAHAVSFTAAFGPKAHLGQQWSQIASRRPTAGCFFAIVPVHDDNGVAGSLRVRHAPRMLRHQALIFGRTTYDV